MILGIYFLFVNFSNFWKFRNKFWYHLKKCFYKLSIHSKLQYLFVNILTHYKIDLKNAVTVPSHQGYSLTYIYGWIKFYCPKVRDPELLVIKKVFFHVTKTWYYLENV